MEYGAIHLAYFMGFIEIVNYELKNVNLEVENDEKWCPMKMASENWNMDIVFLLVGIGAKIYACTNPIINLINK